MTDLPQYATPWTKDGVQWCVVSNGLDDVTMWWYNLDCGMWKVKYQIPRFALRSDYIIGLGRDVPPMPKPKTVATAVPVEDEPVFEYAARIIPLAGKRLYYRRRGSPWELSRGPKSEAEVLAAARAFALAGELLPGESDA